MVVVPVGPYGEDIYIYGCHIAKSFGGIGGEVILIWWSSAGGRV